MPPRGHPGLKRDIAMRTAEQAFEESRLPALTRPREHDGWKLPSRSHQDRLQRSPEETFRHVRPFSCNYAFKMHNCNKKKSGFSGEPGASCASAGFRAPQQGGLVAHGQPQAEASFAES